jgi:Domain of unknown function (DUF4845)
MLKVTVRQPMADCRSTLRQASASIALVKLYLRPSSTESPASTLAVRANRAGRNSQRGAGRLKAIAWTLVIVSFLYVCFKAVPSFVNEYQFIDGMQTLARYATATRQTPEQIRAAVLKEAQTDGIPVTAEDIKVTAVNGNVRINVEYSVTVDLTVYQWTLNFHPAVGNDSLT